MGDVVDVLQRGQSKRSLRHRRAVRAGRRRLRQIPAVALAAGRSVDGPALSREELEALVPQIFSSG